MHFNHYCAFPKRSWCNTVDDIGGISSLTQLTELVMNGTAVTDLSPVRNLLLLERLDISECTQIGMSQVAEI